MPNGLAHLPPGLAGRRNRQSVKTGKWPPRTSAEGGQVEPVLGGTYFLGLFNACSMSLTRW